MAGVKIYPHTDIKETIVEMIIKIAEQELRLRKLEKEREIILEITENQRMLSRAMLKLTKRVVKQPEKD